MNQQPRSFLAEYLKPIDTLLQDPSVVEIAINPNGSVWVERQGDASMHWAEGVTFADAAARNLAGQITAASGGAIGSDRPIVSGKIEYNGAPLRAQVVVEPIIEGGAAISLRKFSERTAIIGDIELLHGKLVDLSADRQMLAHEIVELTEAGQLQEALQLCVTNRLNVLVSGGTSTGKTTFVRALLAMIDQAERILTIEDAYELFPPQPNAVMLKSGESSSTGAAKLLEASLRMRPDRIILGELRGAECKTFLDAINTGHSGSFTTIHADTAEKALDRLALMVMSVGINLSFDEVRRYCEASIDVVVQLARHDGRRGVAQVFVANSH